MFKIIKIGEFDPLSIKGVQKTRYQIDFSPIYQRYGKIWSLEKKRLLIDTIINGFDIPKFYFNYFIEHSNILNQNNFLYAVIDGKQRLESILEFLDDKFALDDEFVFYENPNIQLKGLKFSQISYDYSNIAATIENYILDVVYVVTDEEDKLEELFLRLNGGNALTNAEKRNAIGGYINRKIKEIVESDVFFSDKLRFNNPRYQYQDLLTKLLFIESAGALISIANKALENFVRSNILQTNQIDETINNTVANLQIMSEIFIGKDPLLRGKGIIPVYYYFISRINPSISNFRNFLIEFEEIRAANRQLENPNSILIDFDRRNQQGVYQDKSLNERFQILQYYYIKYSEAGHISNDNVDSLNMEIEDEEYEE